MCFFYITTHTQISLNAYAQFVSRSEGLTRKSVEIEIAEVVPRILLRILMSFGCRLKKRIKIILPYNLPRYVYLAVVCDGKRGEYL